LERLFAGDREGDLTLNDLLAQLEGRGPLALMSLLCLPFMTPVSLPGVSNVFGVVIGYLAGRMVLGLPGALPQTLGGRRIQGELLGKVVRAGLRALRWLERGIHPRPTALVTTPTARRFNAGLLMWGAFLLALPIPPTIPCSNLTPGAAIILISLSMAEEDGVTIWLGYAALFGATVYLGVMTWLQAALIVKMSSQIWHYCLDWWLR